MREDCIENRIHLIDGQQRFTTVSIFLLVLYNKLENIKKSATTTENEKDIIYSLRKRLVSFYTDENGKEKTTPRLELQSQGHNNDDYKGLLGSYKLIEAKESKNSGNRRIVRCSRILEGLIDNYVNNQIGEGKSEKSILFNLLEKIENASMVRIFVKNTSDAYVLFESLNNRGVPLSALDLIKNNFIAKAKTESDTDYIYSKWQEMLKNLGDDPIAQERFLIQYHNAFREYLNSNQIARKPNLIKIYESLLSNDHKSLINDLVDKSEYYSELLLISENERFRSELTSLERIKASPSYVLLLYILSCQAELGLSDVDIKGIINTITKFSFRRSVTDYPSTRDLIKIYIGITDGIKNKEDISTGSEERNIPEYIAEKLKEKSADDETFKKALSGSMYDNNYDATRFILCTLEDINEKNNKEKRRDFWEINKSRKPVWTVEHIFP